MNHMGQFFLKLGLAASMLLWASIAVTPATAASITYSFSGEVTRVQNQLNPPFSVNLSPTAMPGSMTVNTTDLN